MLVVGSSSRPGLRLEQLRRAADVAVGEHRPRSAAAGVAATSCRAPGRARCAAPSRREVVEVGDARGRRRWPASRSSDGVEHVGGRRRRPGGRRHRPTQPAVRRDAAGWRRRRRRRRTPACRGCGRRRPSGPGSAPGCVVVEVELLLVEPERRPSGASASVTSSGTVPRFSPTIVVAVARRLGGDHGEQLLPGVAHVRAVVGAGARRGPTTAGGRPSRGRCAGSRRARRRGRRARRHSRWPLRRPAPGSCGGKPQSWPSAKNSSGGAPTVIAGGEQVGVGPRLEAVRVAADRQVEGERGPTRRPRRRPAGGRRGTGRGGGCARRAPSGGRRRRRRVARRGSGRRRRRRDGRRRSGRCRPARTGRGRAAASSSCAPAAPGERRASRSARRCGRRRRAAGSDGVVEVDLVPVQPADRRVRAGVERLVEERGVQRQRRRARRCRGRAARRRGRRGGRTTAAATARSHSAYAGTNRPAAPASAAARGIVGGGDDDRRVSSDAGPAIAARGSRPGGRAASATRPSSTTASASSVPSASAQLGVADAGADARPAPAGRRRRPARRVAPRRPRSASSTSTTAAACAPTRSRGSWPSTSQYDVSTPSAVGAVAQRVAVVARSPSVGVRRRRPQHDHRARRRASITSPARDRLVLGSRARSVSSSTIQLAAAWLAGQRSTAGRCSLALNITKKLSSTIRPP